MIRVHDSRSISSAPSRRWLPPSRGTMRISPSSCGARSPAAWSALRTGAAWGDVDEPPADVRAQFDHVIGALHVLSHPR